MGLQLVAEQTITVGNAIVVEGPSPSEKFGVVFEDDGETGYLYGLDFGLEENPIVDALQIYNVTGVKDRSKPSVVRIVWSTDGKKAGLLINDYAHAVFDFEAKRGYCRNDFPPANDGWTKFGHAWSEEAEKLLK